MAPVTIGRILITLAQTHYAWGAFYFDFSETHVYNPRWPPHAKFHNGQTMTLALMLCCSSLWCTFKAASSKAAALDNLWTAAIIGNMYCLAGLSAILYPGTAWSDPEFNLPPVQAYLFVGVCAVTWLGYWLESSRVAKAKWT